MWSTMAISHTCTFLPPLSSLPRGGSCHISRRSGIFNSKLGFVGQKTRPSISCSVSMMDGQSDDNRKVQLKHIMDKARKLWDDLPQPVRTFPWNRVLDNFLQLIFEVAASVIKYLSAPLLAISSLSEMSYCAHERKLFFVPVPLVLGFVIARIFKETALESSPPLKDAEVPWHLIAIAIFFTMLKLPGPYYPFWGRICIPHFANGGLLRVFWMMYNWYKKPKMGVAAEQEQSVETLDQN